MRIHTDKYLLFSMITVSFFEGLGHLLNDFLFKI